MSSSSQAQRGDASPPESLRKVAYGKIYAHVVTFQQAIDHIVHLVKSGAGGFVVTPNVDHICLAEDDARLVKAYDEAALSLADGVPLLWMAKALGYPITEKISGSDLFLPLMQRAAKENLGVYFLGSTDETAAKAKEILERDIPGLRIVGVDTRIMKLNDAALMDDVVTKMQATQPGIIVVALGCPKQEYWMIDHAKKVNPAVSLGLGATLDFVAGTSKRAPRWMQKVGLEWTYRLVQEPKRLAHRYLVRDRKIVSIFLRTRRSLKA